MELGVMRHKQLLDNCEMYNTTNTDIILSHSFDRSKEAGKVYCFMYNKTEYIVFVCMLGKFVEKKMNKNGSYKIEQNFVESIQNIIMCINLKLIKSNDVVIDCGEITKINKIILKDGIFIYDAEKYPVFSKKIVKKSISDVEKSNLKLKRILAV